MHVKVKKETIQEKLSKIQNIVEKKRDNASTKSFFNGSRRKFQLYISHRP